MKEGRGERVNKGERERKGIKGIEGEREGEAHFCINKI